MRSENQTSSRLLSALVVTLATGALLLCPRQSSSAGVPALSGCEVPTATPLLNRWGDNNLYFPVTGGSAENPFSWTLAGGAFFAWENEPWRVLSPFDLRSVQLAGGATASAAPICVPFVDNIRMFVRSPGVAGSVLHIHLESLGSIYPTAADFVRHHATADYWVDGSAAGWTLIGGVTIPDGRGADGTQSLTLTLSTSGGRAPWRVDDILMDPWKAH